MVPLVGPKVYLLASEAYSLASQERNFGVNSMSRIYIGTSGWQYDHWKGVFYPQNLPQKDWLGYYTKYFDTVEVNATFYHLMKVETFKKWRNIVGPNFTFAIKGSRFITHIKRLKNCQEEVIRFLNELKGLKGKKNVILWQLPPQMKVDSQRLISFLQILPKTFRHAFEFRDKSWLDLPIYSLLKDYKCALVIQDSPYWPPAEVVTTDFVYLRFHGRESLYASCYSREELDLWAEKVKQWNKENFDVYGYFNNDSEGYAIKNAGTLKKLL